MKSKFKLWLMTAVMWTLPLAAQTISVSTTLTDSDSVTWNNATCTATPYSSTGRAPFYNGVQVPVNPCSVDSSGVLTATLYNTSTMTPVQSQYRFTIQSNTSAPSSVFFSPVTTTNPGLSALLTAPRFLAGYGTYGYSDLEASVVTAGLTYYNNITPAWRQWNGSAWVTVGSGGSSGGPSSPVTITIAANNSPLKVYANVQCTGTADQTCINTAITANCPNSQTGVPGCKVVLMDGVFNTTGPIVIDGDDIDIEGANHCMWGGYNGSIYNTTHPGAVGLGCAQIRASSGGFNLFEARCVIPGGTGTDTNRHRGWRIADLYFVGSAAFGNSMAIQALCNDDNAIIENNVVMDTVNGFNLLMDTAIVRGNSIQGISGVGIFNAAPGIQGRINDNLIFDTGSYGIFNTSPQVQIEHNVFGDNKNYALYNGNDSGAGYSVINGNTIQNEQVGAILWGGNNGVVVSNNTIFNNFLAMTSPAINITGGVSYNITGNTITTFPGVTQTQPAISVDVTSTKVLMTGNNANGTWSVPPFSFASIDSIANANLSAQGQFNVTPSETVASSATPAFTSGTLSSITTLTANVTSFTIANGTNGQVKTLTWCQDATGGRTISGVPTNLRGMGTIGATASKCSSQHYYYYSTPAAWLADGAMITNE